MKNVPTRSWVLMYRVYKDIFPPVSSLLGMWKEKAEKIPNQELRTQALASIRTKTFHCEGGAILALAAGKRKMEAIRFIVAYQTISDFLDNLCDRSTSLDDQDFRTLHESMLHALDPSAAPINYYQFRSDQDDGGYLAALVRECQTVLLGLNGYPKIASALLELAEVYCDLQVHKHVRHEERVSRLKAWFDEHKVNLPNMSWYEFSACAGSTLGIFCLVSYAFQDSFTDADAVRIKKSYFPWVQGLHILLDYFIDQEEDKLGGDLNFCSYYQSREEMQERLIHFIRQAEESLEGMPHYRFHRLIHRGLLGIYLADQKVKDTPAIRKTAQQLVRHGGATSLFFYVNRKIYQKLKPSH